MSTEAEQNAVIDAFRDFMTEVVLVARSNSGKRTPLGDIVSDHLGTPVENLPLVTESLPAHRLVDADIALEHLASRDQDARLIGVTGGQQRYHEDLPQLLSSPHMPYDVGPVEYLSENVGPDAQRQVVAFGLRLLRVDGEPVVVLQRAPRREMGRMDARLEVIATTTESSAAVLTEIRRLMLELSVLRGQVLTFSQVEYGSGSGAVTFLDRPQVEAADIVLPPGTLDRVVGHVVDVGRLRDVLASHGQHLKRGVLLYGPPGTGKTLTVRHLLTRSEGVTSVLLTGNGI